MATQIDASKPIKISDISAPVLTDLQKQVLEGAAQAQFSLTSDAILEAAKAEAGLDDFGDMDFVERLAVMLLAIEEDKGLSAVSLANIWTMLVRYATYRLRVEDMIKRHPEILDIEIDRPIIVAGLPRSGTTHLLGLLSSDDRLRSLPWWEAIAPVPTEADAPTAGDENPRWTRSDEGWQQYEAMLPLMGIMHEFSADHISEDIELQALDFSSYLLEWLAYVPRWRDYYLNHDQHSTYAYMKKVIQLLTFFKGPNRWVIKCPQHMEQLPALKDTFPDATFVVTHRDPVGSIRSAMTMSLYASRLLRNSSDPEEPKGYWIDRYRRLLKACVRDHHVLPENQTVHVYFHEWIKDPDPILKQIYEKAGLAFDDEKLAGLKAYHAAHDPGHKGRIKYDLEGDFGISADEIRSQFDFYFDSFPVRPEVR